MIGALEPERTLILGFEYGGFDSRNRRLWSPLKPATARWLGRHFPQANIRRVNHSPYLCARNRAIRDLLLPDAEAFDWVISIDNDVTITSPGVERFLEVPGDLVACECDVPHMGIWTDPQAFHTPFYRARVAVFRALDPPWFAYRYSADGCELIDCDCNYLAAKARAAGFTTAHGGRCSHDGLGSYLKPFGHQPKLRPQTAFGGAFPNTPTMENVK